MRVAWVAGVLGVVLTGCFEPRTECSPATCVGCCSTSGSCEAGDQLAACGVSGERCSVCSGTQRCEATGCFVRSTIDAGSIDAGSVDAGSVDAGFVDAGSVDAGLVDAGLVDAGSVDAGFVDAGFGDAGFVDADFVDAGPDAGSVDAGTDAGSSDAGTDAGQPGAVLRGRLWMWARIGPSLPQVYAQVPVGSQETLVSAPGRSVSGMAMSEDGAMIAISYDSPAELFVGPTDGGPAQLVRSAIGWIRVFNISPDQGHVAFMEGYQFEDGAMIMPLDGGSAVQATPRSLNFVARHGSAFSPDSRYFAWRGMSSGLADMYVTDTVTGMRSSIASPLAPTASIMNFAWISNSNLLLVSFDLTGTTSPAALHLCAAPDSCAPLPGLGAVRTLSVSRNRALAVIGVDSADAGVGYLDVFRVPLDGGTVTPMATDFHLNIGPGFPPVLSPNGERLAIQGWSTSDRAIHMLPTSGFTQQLSPLFALPNGVGAELAAFDPDSSQLIFRSNLEGFGSPSPDGWGLQRIDLTVPGQQPMLMQRVDGGVVWDFVWTP